MKARYLILFSVLASQTLTGCNAFNHWNQEQKLQALKDGKDFCGKRYLKKFIGTPFDDIEVRDHLPEKYSLRVSDPRIIYEDGIERVWTLNLRYERMHIYVDQDGNIKELKCG